MNNNQLTTTNQNAKLALSKSKSLLNITNSLLLKKTNSNLTNNFQFKPYFSDGHIDSIKSVAITPDGKTIISGSADKTIKLWDINSRMCIKTLNGHTDSILLIAITLDGKTIISGSNDKTIKFWDIQSGECINTLEGHYSGVSSIVIAPDEKTIISNGSNYAITLWDKQSCEYIKKTLQWHTSYVNSVAITPDGKIIISGSDDNTIKLWDVKSGECINTLEGHTNAINSVVITSDGKTIISGSDDNTIKLWDIKSGECLNTLKAHSGSINSVAITPDGKTIIIGSSDKNVKIWNIQSGECLDTPKGYSSYFKSVAVTPDGKTIISVSADNTIKSWDVKSGEHINTLDKQISIVNSLAITPDGKFIITGSEEGTINLCEIKTGKSIRTFNDYCLNHSGSIRTLKVSSDGKYLVSISSYDYERAISEENYDEEPYDTLIIWDIENGRAIRGGGSIDTLGFQIYTTAVHKEWLVSKISYYDTANYYIENISIEDIESGNIIDFLEGYVQNHSTDVTSLAITPDGNTIISGGGNDQKTISVWAEDEDDDYIYEISDGVETIKLWNIPGERYTKVLEGHTDSVDSLVVTPDGKNIVSGSRDNTIKIWNMQSGECVRTLKGHTDAVNSVITQDGETIISRSKDGTIKIWDIQSGECIYTIYNMNDGSTIIMFSDGYFNASEENIDKFIRIDDTSTSCRKLTKEEIEHFCKAKYENKSKIPQIEIDGDDNKFEKFLSEIDIYEDEIPF